MVYCSTTWYEDSQTKRPKQNLLKELQFISTKIYMVQIGVFHFLMGIFRTRDILYRNVKTQDVRHVLDFLHQSILY